MYSGFARRDSISRPGQPAAPKADFDMRGYASFFNGVCFKQMRRTCCAVRSLIALEAPAPHSHLHGFRQLLAKVF
jgi:hypothetical protein